MEVHRKGIKRGQFITKDDPSFYYYVVCDLSSCARYNYVPRGFLPNSKTGAYKIRVVEWIQWN